LIGGAARFDPVAAVFTLLVVVPAGPAVRAEPAFAVRTGYSCGQCHVNRTGGGMRTPFGSIYTQTTLPERLLIWKGNGYRLPADPQALFGYGGDARLGYYAADAKGGTDTASFAMPSANLYAELRIVPGKFGVYLDQRLGSGGSTSRELFALFSFRDGAAYVKAGRLLPAYGWALPDDAAFIREPLGFAFSSPDLGVEVGFEPAHWSTHFAVLNGGPGGRDTDRGKKATVLSVRRFTRSSVGLSAAYDRADAATTSWAGLLGGTSFGRLSLLAEVDGRRSRPEGVDAVDGLAAYVEADLLIRRGMTVKYAHDWSDPSRSVVGDRRQRDSLGFEYVPFPFVQLRAFVHVGDGPPQVAGARDRQAYFELHLFF
jgi:hypothetical protein